MGLYFVNTEKNKTKINSECILILGMYVSCEIILKYKEILWCSKILCCMYMHVELIVLGAQKNHLIETVLLSTHNICFG